MRFSEFPSKYRTTCKNCRRQINIGDMVWGVKGADGKWRIECQYCHGKRSAKGGGKENPWISVNTESIESLIPPDIMRYLTSTGEYPPELVVETIIETPQKQSPLESLKSNAKWRRTT